MWYNYVVCSMKCVVCTIYSIIYTLYCSRAGTGPEQQPQLHPQQYCSSICYYIPDQDLYVGALPQIGERGPAFLRAFGITRVLNATSDVADIRVPSDAASDRVEINHMMNTAGTRQREFRQTLERVARWCHGCTTLVGCEHGCHRSTLLLAILLVMGGSP